MFFNVTGFATDKTVLYVEQLENQMFSMTYENDDIAGRLDRLEELIFGRTYKDESSDVRMLRLKALLSTEETAIPTEEEYQDANKYPDVITLDNKPYKSPDKASNSGNTEHSFLPDSDTSTAIPLDYEQKHPRQEYSYHDDVEVEDYPAVSFLETKVFNNTYKGEDVSQRLNRLEKELFNETSSNKSLSERLDSLKVAVLGTTNMPLPPRDDSGRMVYNYPANPSGGTYSFTPNMNPQQYYQSPEMNTFQQGGNYPGINEVEYSPLEPGYGDNSMSSESLKEVTSRLEEDVLGQSFQGEPLNTRLDRLEMHIFNRTAPGYTPESRLERLISVVAADSTSDPHDLTKIKRLRKIQTGLTVGGLLFSILKGFLF
jgi:hypothetical protein